MARKITIYRLSARIAGIASVLDLDLLYSSAHYEQQNVSTSTPLVCENIFLKPCHGGYIFTPRIPRVTIVADFWFAALKFDE